MYSYIWVHVYSVEVQENVKGPPSNIFYFHTYIIGHCNCRRGLVGSVLAY